MSRSRVLPLALAACAAVLAVSGCAAGFEPSTSPSMKPRDAANYPAIGNTSPVAVRHAFILGPGPEDPPYAVGDSAAIYLSLVNQSKKADKLVSAQSPAADEVTVAGNPAKADKGGKTAKPDRVITAIELPAPPPGSDEADPVAVGQPPYSKDTVTLSHLSRELRNGSIVRVTFTFQRAGEITMDLPVVPRAAYRSTLSPVPSDTIQDKSTPTGTASATP